MSGFITVVAFELATVYHTRFVTRFVERPLNDDPPQFPLNPEPLDPLKLDPLFELVFWVPLKPEVLELSRHVGHSLVFQLFKFFHCVEVIPHHFHELIQYNQPSTTSCLSETGFSNSGLGLINTPNYKCCSLQQCCYSCCPLSLDHKWFVSALCSISWVLSFP